MGLAQALVCREFTLYVNPLASHGDVARQEWFGCACRPPNIARLLASLGRCVYSQSERGAWVHLYIQGQAELDVGGRRVVIEQKTAYPWKEDVSLRIRPPEPTKFALSLRMPGWVRGLDCNLKKQELAAEIAYGLHAAT